jgi:hypothetical protein
MVWRSRSADGWLNAGMKGVSVLRVSMHVRGGGREPGDLEKELAGYLDSQERLRGRVHLVTQRQQAGGMTQSIATVVAELGPAAVTACGAALIAWIRHRTADTRVTVRRPDGARFEIAAQRVRGLGPAEVTALVEQIAGALTDDPPQAP